MKLQRTVWCCASMNGGHSNSNPSTGSIGPRFGIQNGFELPTDAWPAPNSFSDSTMFTAIALPAPSTSENGCLTFSRLFSAYDPLTRRRNVSILSWTISHITSTTNSWITSRNTISRSSGLQRMHLGSTSLNLTSAQSKSMHSPVLMTTTITHGVFESTAISDCVIAKEDHTNVHSQKCSIINLEWH